MISLHVRIVPREPWASGVMGAHPFRTGKDGFDSRSVHQRFLNGLIEFIERNDVMKDSQGVPGLSGFGSSFSHFTDGGLRIELSDCCNERVVETKGGLRWKVCGKCGRKIVEKRFGAG